MLLIHPKDIKWKYFYADSNGTIVCCKDVSEIPSIKILAQDGSEFEVKRNKVAILTTSLFFGEENVEETLEKVSNLIRGALFYENRPSEFCLAFPYDEEKVLENPRDELIADYADIVTHEFSISKKVGYVGAKTGAAQIASAIEKGFHIHCISGGVQIGQKLELVRDYFRENPLPSSHTKSIIAGFSGGSEIQFGLKEIAQYLHTGNAAKTFSIKRPSDPKTVKEIITIFEARDDYKIIRVLDCEDPVIYRTIKDRFDVDGGKAIEFHTYFPRQFISAIDSPYRPDFSDKKLILGLEGYLQSESGYNVHEALEIGLQSEVLKPNQIIAIVIENFVAKEEELEISRFHGHVRQFEEMDQTEKDKILNIVKDAYLEETGKEKEIIAGEEETLIRSYIARTNNAYENEVQRIREVAQKYEIPIIMGCEIRSGHAKNHITQPVLVESIDFSKLGKIAIESIVRRRQLVEEIPLKTLPQIISPKIWQKSYQKNLLEEESIIYERSLVTEGYSYSKTANEIKEKCEDFNQAFLDLKLSPFNEAARKYLEELKRNPGQTCEIIAGNSANIAETKLLHLNNRGLLCIMPNRVKGKGINQDFDIIRLLNSGRLGVCDIIETAQDETENIYKLPFVILAAQKPSHHNKKTLKPVIDGFNFEVPIFVTESFFKNIEILPALFYGDIDLQKLCKDHSQRDISASSATRLGEAEILNQERS